MGGAHPNPPYFCPASLFLDIMPDPTPTALARPAVQKPALAKGTRDFTAPDMARRHFVFDALRGVFQRYGFEPLETPAIENLTTLTGKYGEEGDRLIFKILASGDFLGDVAPDELLAAKAAASKGITAKIADKALRYDLTIPLARHVAMNRGTMPFPYRRYQMQPVWRADRPQRGRFREFYQCDADILGSDALFNEAELIALYADGFAALNLPVHIRINNRKVLAGVAEVLGMDMNTMTVALDKLDKIGWEGVATELAGKGIAAPIVARLQALFAGDGDGGQAPLQRLAEALQHNETGTKGLAELQQTLALTSQLTATKPIVDFTLARGLDYYTGFITEVVAQDANMGSLGGGGRYDNLTGIFGAPGITGVGISFGFERIVQVMEEAKLFPEHLQRSPTTLLLCAMDEPAFAHATALLGRLRHAGLAVQLFPEASKPQKMLKYADAKGIAHVALIGAREVEAGFYAVKTLANGTRNNFTEPELLAHFAQHAH